MPISINAGEAPRHVAVPLRAIIRAALAAEGKRAGEIAVVLTNDPALRALNHDWRGIDRATDVLSFSYDEPAIGRNINGDLVISLERMREQAARFRVSEGAELARLVIHGALHLAGLDHQRPAERRAMRAREDAVLKTVATHVRVLDAALRTRAVEAAVGPRRSRAKTGRVTRRTTSR